MNQTSIIEGCMKGKKLYQQRLVELYSPMLFTVARRYAPRVDDAKDILQDALIKILTALQKNYRDDGKAEAWMRKIVITTALNSLKKNASSQSIAKDDILEHQHCPPEAYSQLGAEELLKLIAALPNGYKQVFNLAVIDCYSHGEIANIMGITESTSRSQLQRARRLLQQQINALEKIQL